MPIALSLPLVLLAGVLVVKDKPRNIWASQYSSRPAEAMAEQFESEARPVFRHRHEIIRLIGLRKGQVGAEIGAGSGFLSRLIAREIGPTGLAIATELDPKMIAYMNKRAATEGL